MWLKMGVRSPEDIPELATQNTLGSEDEASVNEHKPKYTLVLCTGAGVPEFWPICRSRSRSLFSSGKTPAALIFWILCCKLLSDIGKRPTKFDKCPTNKYSEQHTTIIEKKVKTRM
jgi:hypothetical protein